MSEKDTGGAAFPRAAAQLNIGYVNEQRGMTLRDYFAAKAMQATVSNPHTMREIASRFPPEMDMLEGISGYAYLIADKMLESRNDKD